MFFREALKAVGLKLGTGQKVKCSPHNRAAKAEKVWRQSASRMLLGDTANEVERSIRIERADYRIMTGWETLTKFYCRHCGYVVDPQKFHRHCPDCGKLMRKKTIEHTEEGYPIIKESCRCGYMDIDVLD